MGARTIKTDNHSRVFIQKRRLFLAEAVIWKTLIILVMGWLLLSTTALAGEIDKKYFFRCHHRLKVMTQNLYIGADIFRVLEPGPPAGAPGLPEQLWIPAKVAEAFAMIQHTDFVARAEVLADQIASSEPDLIGLQEVYRIRYQSPSDFPSPEPNADTVLWDYLTIVLQALQARNLDYEAVAVVEDADVELPMLVGFNGSSPLLDDVRITDHDVILVRKNVGVTNIATNNFFYNIELPLGGMTVTFLRGYCAVDAKIKNRTYRFVNAHLEVASEIPGSDIIQQLQAHELVDSLAHETRPIILVGDFNSGPQTPEAPAYDVISGAGFVDAWQRRHWRTNPGYTCCQDEDLGNQESLLTERFDLIFVRNDLGVLPFSIIGPVRIFTLGDEPEDKTESGLWPSDHAGVFAKLRIPYLDFPF